MKIVQAVVNSVILVKSPFKNVSDGLIISDDMPDWFAKLPRVEKKEPDIPVPPLWSGFPDFGPDPDFFGQIGPDTVRILLKSPDFS